MHLFDRENDSTTEQNLLSNINNMNDHFEIDQEKVNQLIEMGFSKSVAE